MPNLVINTAIRSLFRATSREKALAQAQEMAGKYAELCEGITDDIGRKPVMVPPMRGVDMDMRGWSLFMLLEHNTIVNRSITAMTTQLANGETLHGDAVIDPKHDVMPSASPGIETVEPFQASIVNHLEVVEQLGELRGTATSEHPVFGEFDAHMWNCMFAFHLKLHYPHALHILRGCKQPE